MKKSEKILLIAIIKGLVHSIVMPGLIMVLVNFFFTGNYGFLAGVSYLFIPYMVYLTSDDKDISRKTFQYVLFSILGTILLILASGAIKAAFDPSFG